MLPDPAPAPANDNIRDPVAVWIDAGLIGAAAFVAIAFLGVALRSW